MTTNPYDLSDFNYFQDATEHENYSCFGSQSWSKIALQMSYYEPAVRHAVYALGSLLNDSITSQQGEVECPARTLQHYTESISYLNQGFSFTSYSPRTALVLCLSFIYIELLRNNIGQAIAHCRGGLTIIANHENSTTEETVEPCLPRAFTRLHAEVQLHGNPQEKHESSQPAILELGCSILPPRFKDIDHSRSVLEHISLATFHTLRRLKRLTGGSARIPQEGASLELLALVHAIEEQKDALALWHQMSLALRMRHTQPIAEEVAAMSILEVQYTAQNLMLACLDDPFEMCFDTEDFLVGFERIIALAEDFVNHKQIQSRFQLSLDTGLLPALFFVALKCRVPELRSKAVDIMRLCPHREGLWHRGRLIQVAMWKAHKEGLYIGIPEPADRIYLETADLVASSDGGNRIVIRYRQGVEAREVSETWDEAISKRCAWMADVI